MFEKIKEYYDDGLWSIERLRTLTQKGILTKDEYKIIVKNEYKE